MVSLEQLHEARQNMLRAWGKQSQTTADDGCDLVEAANAIIEALAAQHEYNRLYELYWAQITKPNEWPEEGSASYFYYWYCA